jgi:hypothetical protein
MNPERRPGPGPDGQKPEEAMRPRDWAVAAAIALVLLLIIVAIFRMGLTYLYG